MIVVMRSEREETQEDKINGAILISTHSWSPKKGELYFDPPLIVLHVNILAFLAQILP
jgi:hypothetical protein